MFSVVLTTAALGLVGPQAVPRPGACVHAVDAAFGRFVSVPVLESGSDDRLDTGLASQDHHHVDGANQFEVDEFGCGW